jgi:hypothetical protein
MLDGRRKFLVVRKAVFVDQDRQKKYQYAA